MVKKFILSEKEKSRISNMHIQKILLERGFKNLNQSITEQEQTVQYYKDENGKVIKLVGNYSPPLGSTPATPEDYVAQNPTITVTPPQGQTPPTVATRYSTAVCPGKDTKRGARCDNKVLKAQVRMNDECPSNILTVKLKEDGIDGPKTDSAFAACKGKLTPTKVAGGGGTTTGGGTTLGGGTTQPPIGGAITQEEIIQLTT